MHSARLTILKHSLLAHARNGGIALAFSGGTDSSFLLAVLKDLNEEKPFPLTAFHMHSILQTSEELEGAVNRAKEAGITLEIFDINPLSIPEISNNSPLRCYHCKRSIFAEIRKRADKNGLRNILDGTNADDLLCDRPGIKALAEYSVFSPLAESGFTKREIRAAAAGMNLKCAYEASNSCLATRFGPAMHLFPQLLENTAAAERILRNALSPNADLRFRLRENGSARIEADQRSIAQLLRLQNEIFPALRALGFQHISIDFKNFRTENMEPSVQRS